MWPYDTAEANWLADGSDVSHTHAANEKAAAQTATVTDMTDTTRTASTTTAIPAPANCNAPAAHGSMLGRIAARLRAWRSQADARGALYAMSDRELRDIGLTRADIDAVTAARAPVTQADAPSRHQAANPAINAGVMGNALMGLTRGATGWDRAA